MRGRRVYVRSRIRHASEVKTIGRKAPSLV